MSNSTETPQPANAAPKFFGALVEQVFALNATLCTTLLTRITRHLITNGTLR